MWDTWIRRLAKWGAALVALPCLLSLFGRWNIWLNLLVHFRFHYAAALLLLGLLLLWKKEKPWLWLCGGLLLLQLVSIVPLYIPASLATPPAPKERLHIISWNALRGNTNHQAAREYLLEKNVEVLVLLEITPNWERALAPVLQKYPYQKREARTGFFGLMVLSKYPLSHVQVHDWLTVSVPLISARVSKGEQELNIIATHVPSPPDPKEIRWRNEMLLHIAELGTELGPNCLLAGDLNTTSFSTQFKGLLEQTGWYDSRRGFGDQATWPATLGVGGIALDHFLLSPSIQVITRSVGPNLGSDHRPIEIEIQW